MKTIDKRMIQSQQKIIRAFDELLQKYDYQQLSKAQITKTAQVNRSTFYAHYDNKQAVLTQLLSQNYLVDLKRTLASNAPLEQLASEKILHTILMIHQKTEVKYPKAYLDIKTVLSNEMIEMLEVYFKELWLENRQVNVAEVNFMASLCSWGMYGVAMRCANQELSLLVACQQFEQLIVHYLITDKSKTSSRVS
ncbi:TetR/AcrR family transcriptional regulator [Vagococcus zengguangii]|uniref:TetR/AcrR family transcriptional regulator n=1 Tax=Vagococcus zengguangii TaxID=2571750 RepID=A0A4D7CQV8_9ENTE|nr:TetR family transcriptional regulator [Vagococcus zengguangii]QCI86449.1 TetR/AcrR family transcriptional regulator [Vagococcus zengguangii]TLG81301.1 TetR/AcrR family transcriptional regulator [Vagococcus zengguangii]